MKTETYPSGRTVTTSYDSANRPYSASGSLSSATTNYVTQTTYWPHGGVLQQGYGNNLFRKWGYINGELEPTGYWDTIGADPSPSLYLRLEFPHWGTATNTGTPQGTTIYAGSSTDWTSLPNVTQTFGFDNLNRLVSASEDSTWSQSYNYDQYGNMWMPSSTLPGSGVRTGGANIKCL